MESRGIDIDDVVLPSLGGEPPPSVSQMDLAGRLEDRDRSHALVAWNINIAASNPDQARLHRALRREDLFTVVVDLFPTDTVRFADIVLPAASFLEFDDLVVPYFDLTLAAQVKASEPLGESLPNQEIFRRLSAAMGFTEPALQESDTDLIAAVLAGTGLGLDFAELARRGTVAIGGEPVVQFADLVFPTPSGRVEIASDRAEADGFPRTPLPLVDERPAAGRLRLLSPASSWLLNDSFANDAKVARRLGRATVTLHPADAAGLGLTAGTEVLLENDTGAMALELAISDAVPCGVALSHKGRWPGAEPSGANVNALNPGEKADMGESTTVHGVEVRIRPAAEPSTADSENGRRDAGAGSSRRPERSLPGA